MKEDICYIYRFLEWKGMLCHIGQNGEKQVQSEGREYEEETWTRASVVFFTKERVRKRKGAKLWGNSGLEARA